MPVPHSANVTYAVGIIYTKCFTNDNNRDVLSAQHEQSPPPTFIIKSLGQLMFSSKTHSCDWWLMGLVCCYGHILHPISTDLLLLCGVLMTAVGGRWLALISFVSLIMRLSQRGLAEGLWWGLFWTSASLFVLGEPAAPARKKVIINMQRGEEYPAAGAESLAWIIIKRWHGAGSHLRVSTELLAA